MEANKSDTNNVLTQNHRLNMLQCVSRICKFVYRFIQSKEHIVTKQGSC